MGDVSVSIADDLDTFNEAVEYVTTTDPEDIDPDYLLTLVDRKSMVEGYVRRVSERVSFSGNSLLFDGDVIDGSLSEAIVRLAGNDESGDPTKLVNFLENLMANPSEHSREQLYDWLGRYDFTITQDGHFLAYKGLREDFTSINSGPGIVNSVSYRNTNLDNSPGNIVEIARSTVVADSFVGCASGLHAGTYEYANGFRHRGGKLVLVKINPRDVVSVPTDCDSQKIRVCRYEVLEEIAAKVDQPVWDDPEEDSWDEPDDWGDPYGDEDEDWDDHDSFDEEIDEDFSEDDEDLSDVEDDPTTSRFATLRGKFFGNF